MAAKHAHKSQIAGFILVPRALILLALSDRELWQVLTEALALVG